MNAAARPPVPGSLSNAAYEQRLRDAVMDAAPLLNAQTAAGQRAQRGAEQGAGSGPAAAAR